MGSRESGIVSEYLELRDPHADPELEAVKAAIFLEDTFGLLLTDEQIDSLVHGSAAGMLALVKHPDERP